MKKWSKHWKNSKQPRKQRKYRVNAPLNIKHKFLSANLSEVLKKKYKKRNFILRKGDKVKVLRGQFKKREGKIEKVFLKKVKVYVEGVENIKKDGSKAFYQLDPSNLQIIDLNLDDKKRIEALERNIKHG